MHHAVAVCAKDSHVHDRVGSSSAWFVTEWYKVMYFDISLTPFSVDTTEVESTDRARSPMEIDRVCTSCRLAFGAGRDVHLLSTFCMSASLLAFPELDINIFEDSTRNSTYAKVRERLNPIP